MNKLGQESSPYLLQHKDNPIHWWPWGDKAFAQARAEQKPIFLSVGYSTCHWCHVMAHESFENQDVADVLNERFISIKVDREERPDVDEIYMKSLLAMTGGGGWPMSVWLTSDGVPFFAGTYFPQSRFVQLLKRIDDLWRQEKAALMGDGEKLLQAIRQEDQEGFEIEMDPQLDLAAYLNHFQYAYDEKYGGFGQAPKFPQTMNLRVLMRSDVHTGLDQAQTLVTHTLQQMSRGGMYDHLSGGFHRYSVDREWLVPHFEKMLYDQAMIVLTLLEAQALYKVEEFAEVIRETLDYVLREMTDPLGGFYSAQDADSLDPDSGHKEEGYFATYSWSELKNTLSESELNFVERVYGARESGQFEGRNVLHLQDGFDRSIKSDPLWGSATEKLKALRSSKPPPHLDDKVIVSWNGWMIQAMARAGYQLGEPRYLLAAQNALSFLCKDLFKEGVLQRYWRSGKSVGLATSEDYASLISACLCVYQIDFDLKWARIALQLQEIMDQKFWDSQNGSYFISDGSDPNLPLRSKDNHDGVYPSANSMAAHNLLGLYALTGESKHKEQFEQLNSSLGPLAQSRPGRLSHFAMAMDSYHQGLKVAVLGKGEWPHQIYQELRKTFKPYLMWAKGGEAWPVTKGKDQLEGIFVCQEGQCLAPAANATEALKQI